MECVWWAHVRYTPADYVSGAALYVSYPKCFAVSVASARLCGSHTLPAPPSAPPRMP